MTESGMRIAADIGGTNARFALVDAAGELDEVRVLAVADHGSAAAALDAYRRACGSPAITAACLAVAGPVAGDRAELTNAGWAFDAQELAAALGAPVRLVNDFHAQAAGLPGLDAGNVESYGGGAPGAGLRLVLGPGTGMGVAAWLPPLPGGSRRGTVIPTETGHTDAAAGDALEFELLGVLRGRFDRVSYEHVLNGAGLAYLYWAMAQVWGVDDPALEQIQPADVTRRGLQEEEPMALHTLEVYANWLGCFAGNLALTFLPRGGVFLTGAMAARLAPILARGGYRRRFEERPPLDALVRSIPTARITQLDFGLHGAALCLPE